MAQISEFLKRRLLTWRWHFLYHHRKKNKGLLTGTITKEEPCSFDCWFNFISISFVCVWQHIKKNLTNVAIFACGFLAFSETWPSHLHIAILWWKYRSEIYHHFERFCGGRFEAIYRKTKRGEGPFGESVQIWNLLEYYHWEDLVVVVLRLFIERQTRSV